MKISWSGFRGENRALHPLLLAEGTGTLSLNQNPVRGDLRPWRSPLTVATVPAGRQTIYRMGRDVASDAQYWLSWPGVVHAVRGMVAEDTTERTYFTGDGFPKWTDNTMALTSAPYPTAWRQLGLPAPATVCLLQAEYVAPDAELGLHVYKVTTAEVASLAVGQVLRFVLSDASQQNLTLVGVGGVVTMASLAAEIEALTGLTATVVAAVAAVAAVAQTSTTPYVPAVPAVLAGVRIKLETAQAALSFVIKKKTGTSQNYDPLLVGYGTSFWALVTGGDSASMGAIPSTTNWYTSFVAGSFASATGVMVQNQAGATGTDGAAATATVSWQSVNATATPVGQVLAIAVNGLPPVARTLYAGAGTFPPAVTIATLKTIFASVDGLKAETVLSADGVNYDLKLSTYATGVNARFDIKQIIPAVTDIFTSVATSVAVKAASILTESRYYTYTYVSDTGEESAPAAPSAELICSVDAIVTITSLASPPAGNYGINRIRIYRTQSGLSGDANFFFSREIASTLTQTTDDGRPLSEVLPSTTWLAPPANLSYLTGLWNGMLAGISDGVVRFSESYKPYAWPIAYDVVVPDAKAVALGVFGQNLLVLTTGRPQLVTGASPESMESQALTLAEACVAPQSVVSFGHGVAWACPDGLAYYGAGGAKMLTAGLMTRDDWQALNPQTMVASLYEGAYLCFFTVAGVTKGFMIDPGNPSGLFFMDFAAQAVYFDELQDALYLLDGVNIKKWDAGSLQTASCKSKHYRSPKPVNFACAEVTADSYPLTFKLYADGALKHTQSVLNKAPFRLPGGYLATHWQLELSTTTPVQGVAVAESMQEISEL